MPICKRAEFEVELVAHLDKIRGLSIKLCRNPVEAEDLVQDTLLKALRYQASFELGTNLPAWLRRIMVSIFISSRRRRKSERLALDRLAHDPNTWARAATHLELFELSQPVKTALQKLKHPFRDVVDLVDLNELSYAEAAERLAVPLGTVMSRLSRGRKQLAIALEGGLAA